MASTMNINNLLHKILTPACIDRLQAEFAQISLPEGWTVKLSKGRDFNPLTMDIYIIAPCGEVINMCRKIDLSVSPSIDNLPLPKLVIEAIQVIFMRMKSDYFTSRDYNNPNASIDNVDVSIKIDIPKTSTDFNTGFRVILKNTDIAECYYYTADNLKLISLRNAFKSNPLEMEYASPSQQYEKAKKIAYYASH